MEVRCKCCGKLVKLAKRENGSEYLVDGHEEKKKVFCNQCSWSPEIDSAKERIHEQPQPRNAACGSAYFRTVFDKYVWGGRPKSRASYIFW